ncbi:MAG: tyrosine-type recombinase/integrase [Chromatiaceae bacterium]
MRRQPKPRPSFPSLVQAFFVEHLTQQRALSQQTVAAYRDAFMLLLGFAEARLGRSPAMITLADMTPDLITAFLDHLKRDRHNSVRSRNARLAALRSFLKSAAHRDVSSLSVIEHALGVPAKRFERPMFGYLSQAEMLAVIGTPGGTWFSQRDHVLLLLLYNTGARVSEIAGVKVGEVVLDEGAACVHLHGKGRKQRSVPLWRSTVRAIRAWFRRNPEFGSDSPLLPNGDGQSMSRWNVIQRLDRAVRLAVESCPDLATRQISPHMIRHTTAMHLLQSGVDISVIGLWLGHGGPATTHQYVEADLAMKERALARIKNQRLSFGVIGHPSP